MTNDFREATGETAKNGTFDFRGATGERQPKMERLKRPIYNYSL
ncbi:hypothetical protein [Paenibacillus urinalis]